MSFIRKIFRAAVDRWKVTVPIAGLVLAGLAWLAFGFFGIHTAFIDNKVDEAGPVFDTPAVPAEVTSQSVSDAQPSVDPTDEPVVDDSTSDDAPTTDAAVDAAPVDAEPEPAEAAPETTEAPAAPQVVTEASGQFAGTSRYDVTGEATVLGNGTGQRFLRFEGFESSNGPDLNVYLFNPNDSSDFIDLGDLKGNVGDQNYEIPQDVDLSVYSEVSIWCVRFSTGFGSATLTAA